MSTKIIPHIFGSILSLEKSLLIAKQQRLKLPSEDLPKILAEMRKLAQLIQLQFAKKDDESAARSLKLFYGLLSMIRPLIMDAFKKECGIRAKRQIVNLH